MVPLSENEEECHIILSNNVTETFVNYTFLFRSWGFGDLHGNYILLCCLISPLLPFLSRFWATPLPAEMTVCVWKTV